MGFQGTGHTLCGPHLRMAEGHPLLLPGRSGRSPSGMILCLERSHNELVGAAQPLAGVVLGEHRSPG